MTNRATKQRAIDEAGERFVAAAEQLGSAFLADSTTGSLVETNTDIVGHTAIHCCVRLLLIEQIPPAAALRSWNDAAERSATLERQIIRADEPGLRLELSHLDRSLLSQIMEGLRAADETLVQAGIDDPIGTLYECSLERTPHRTELGGLALERAPRSRRRAAGAFYTPTELINHLTEQAVHPGTTAEPYFPRICDPACGSGRFLTASLRRIVTAHADGSDVGALMRRAVSRLYGVDRDPIAIELTRFRLWTLTGFDDEAAASLKHTCRVGDALLGAPADEALAHESADAWCQRQIGQPTSGLFHWHIAFPKVFTEHRDVGATPGFDAVLGNPPFLNQLSSSTAHHDAALKLISAWSRGSIKRYADAAAAFMVRSLQLVRPEGRIALVLPMSLLASQDAAGMRQAVMAACRLEGLWLSTQPVFTGTDVLTCAPVLHAVTTEAPPVSRWSGVPPTPMSPVPPPPADASMQHTWSHLVADAFGVPLVSVNSVGTLGDIATATADFRDQYYGLEGFLVDRTEGPDDAFPKLITAGLIDPADCRWGRATTRVLKRAWAHPRIDLERMQREGSLGGWVDSRRVPKLLVATQTRVIEAIADEAGALVPSTPVITVLPRDRDDLWRIAAVLLSPVVSAVALQRVGGSALTGDTIKLAAKQVLELPVPRDEQSWNKAADHARRASSAGSDADRLKHLRSAAAASVNAFGIDKAEAEPLLEWWADRLPKRSRGE